MKMFYRIKYNVTLMVVLALLMQIVGPIVGDFVYAQDSGEAFTFQVVKHEDGSGRFHWTYNPKKANGETDFEVYLGLKLNYDFSERLIDAKTGNEIGQFTISTDGIVIANINKEELKAEEPDETENLEEIEDEQESEEIEEPIEEVEKETEEVEEPEETDEEENEAEGVSAFSEIRVTMANRWESLGELLVAETEGTEEETSGGGIIPFGLIPMDGGEGRNLGEVDGFNYGIYFYNEVVNGNPVLTSRREDGEINIEELESLSTLFFGVEFRNIEGITFKDGDYLNINISPLLELEGFSDGVEELKDKVDIDLDGKKFAEYWVEDGNLKVKFTNVENINGKNAEGIFYNIGFDIEKIIKNGTIIEEIKFTEPIEKIFTINRKNIETGKANIKLGKYEKSDDTVTWTIDVNKDLKNLGDSTLTDIIPEEFKVSGVKVYDLDIYLEDGKLKEKVKGEGIEQDLASIWNDTEKKLTIPLGELDKIAKRVIIKTKIVGNLEEIKGESEITNTASLNSTEFSGTTGKFKRQKSLTKKAVGVENSPNKIKWTVEYRGSGDKGEYTIIDTPDLPADVGLILDKNSIEVKKGSSALTYDKESIVVENDKITFNSLPNDDTDLKVLEYVTELVYNTKTGVFEDNENGKKLRYMK